MNCADARPLLDLLCDGALEAKDSAMVLAHLKTCNDCQCEWNDLEELHSSFHEGTDQQTLPPGLMEKISEKLKDEERKQHKRFLAPIMAVAAAFLLLGFLCLPWIEQSKNGPVSTKTASAETLVDDLLAEGTLEPIRDRNELASKLGYELKYVRLPEWQMNTAGVYKAPASPPIARFDFVRKGQSGNQYLSCYQARQGAIQANTADFKNLEDKHVLFGHHGKFQFALWSQSGRDYLFVTSLPQPQLEEIVRRT
jgi:hypothetical protein